MKASTWFQQNITPLAEAGLVITHGNQRCAVARLDRFRMKELPMMTVRPSPVPLVRQQRIECAGRRDGVQRRR